jgi:hypothetical protein
MSFTVVPLHNLSLEPGTRIEFGDGFVFQDAPEWLKTQPMLKDMSRHDRQSVADAKHALVAEYAAALGEPDPSWKGQPKSVQELKFESAILANIAFWVSQPSAVCYTNVFHATSWPIPRDMEKQAIVQQIKRQSPLHCHPNDLNNPVIKAHVVKAGGLHAVLCTIPRKNPVWEAMRAGWAGLTMYSVDRRYPFFWMGLESLFGADDTAEIGYKLAQRISFFLANNPTDARDLFRKVKTCYKMRSTIIHGGWKDDPKIDAVMAVTEGIFRRVFLRLLENPEMLRTFLSKDRDKFLEEWVFSRYTDPPPYPAVSPRIG